MISPTKFYNDRIADYRDYRRKALITLAVPGAALSIMAMIPDFAESHWALSALAGVTTFGALAIGWTGAEIQKSEWRLARRFAHHRRVNDRRGDWGVRRHLARRTRMDRGLVQSANLSSVMGSGSYVSERFERLMSDAASVSPEWREQAYPLQQLQVRVQGTRHHNRADLIDQLRRALARIEAGDQVGQHHDDDFGYAFELTLSPDGPSFFDEACGYDGKAPE